MGTRRILRRVGWALIVGACLVLAFLGYQLYITDLLNDRVQAEAMASLDAELAERRSQLPEPEEVPVTVPEEEPETPAFVRTSFVPEAGVPEGEALGRMTIEKIGVDEVVFEGVDSDTLKKGPGHMPWTPVPGQPGNAVISGHRTTYGRPFYDLDQLEVGDEIHVETAVGEHVFEIREIHIVEPDDVWVTEEKPGAWLTLTTCHPHFSARERLVVQAELVQGPNAEYASLLASQAEAEQDA